MANYQNCLLHFWDRTAKAHSTVSENFKGYQHYEFTVLKDLSETSKKLAEITAGTNAKTEEGGLSAEEELIMLEQQTAEEDEQFREEEEKRQEAAGIRRTSLEQLLFTEDASPESEKPPIEQPLHESLLNLQPSEDRKRPKPDAVAPKLPPPPRPGAQLPKQNLPPSSGDSLLGLMMENDSKSEIDLLDDILGTGSGQGSEEQGSFAYQWTHVFGQKGDENACAKPVLEQQRLDTSPGDSPLHSASTTAAKKEKSSFLPSQLLDMNFEEDLMSGLNLAPQKPPNQAQQLPAKPSSLPSKAKDHGKDAQKKNAWFNLFADLDPIQNPDAVGNPEGDSNRPC